MYNQPYFIPGYFASVPQSMMGNATGIGSAMNRSLGGPMRSTMRNAMNGTRLATQGANRGLGLFGRLGNSMRAIRGVNWGGLITNASKTLNVVNQAIPLVRQVGPMVNNMKSMLRIASIFKDETDKKPTPKMNKNSNTNSNNHSHKSVSNNNINLEGKSTTDVNDQDSNRSLNLDDGSPTFFIS